MKREICRALADLPGVKTGIRMPESPNLYWERGAFVIPRDQFWIIHNSLVGYYNAVHCKHLLQFAEEMYDYLRLHRERGETVYSALMGNGRWTSYNARLRHVIEDKIGANGLGYKPFKPRKSWFPEASQNTKVLRYGDWVALSVDRKNRVFRWEATGSNAAEIHSIAAVENLFNVLAVVEHNKTSGGLILTSDGAVGFGPIGEIFIG